MVRSTLRQFLIDTRWGRLLLSFLVGNLGPLPCLILSYEAQMSSFAAHQSASQASTILFAPYFPGAYLATVIYTPGMDDPIFVILTFVLTGLFYTVLVFVALTLWRHFRTRRSG